MSSTRKCWSEGKKASLGSPQNSISTGQLNFTIAIDCLYGWIPDMHERLLLPSERDLTFAIESNYKWRSDNISLRKMCLYESLSSKLHETNPRLTDTLGRPFFPVFLLILGRQPTHTHRGHKIGWGSGMKGEVLDLSSLRRKHKMEQFCTDFLLFQRFFYILCFMSNPMPPPTKSHRPATSVLMLLLWLYGRAASFVWTPSLPVYQQEQTLFRDLRLRWDNKKVEKIIKGPRD